MGDSPSVPPPRGLLKKLRKQLANGRGASSKTEALLSTAEGAALLAAARFSVSLDVGALRDGIAISSAQSLLLELCTPVRASSRAPPFLILNNSALLRTVVLFIVRGARSSAESELGVDGALVAVRMRHAQREWTGSCKRLTPASESLLLVRDSPAAIAATASSRANDAAAVGQEDLLLRLSELAAHGFPCVGVGVGVGSGEKSGRVAGASHDAVCTLCIPEGHILTRTAHADLHALLGSGVPPCSIPISRVTAPSEDTANLVGIDCEMCAVAGSRSQLARLTLVSAPRAVGHKRARREGGGVGDAGASDSADTSASSDDVLFDELVIPQEPVVDYRTAWSGVSAESLSHARTTFAAAQDAAADALDANGGGVAAGHSLDSDFSALRLIHTRVSDTSLIFRHPAGPPKRFALRTIALRELGRVIQADAGGHDSAEDARAARDLVILARGAEGGGGGDGSANGAITSSPAVDDTVLYSRWIAALSGAPRSHISPSTDVRSSVGVGGAGAGGGCGGPAAVSTGGALFSRGLAGVLREMKEPPSAPRPRLVQLPRGAWAQALLDLPLSGSVSVVGAAQFVNAHVTGAAAGVACESDAFSTVSAAVVREAARLTHALQAGGGTTSARPPRALVVADALLRVGGDVRVEMRALADALPAGVLLVAVTQGNDLVFRAEKGERLCDADCARAAAARAATLYAVGK